MPAGVRFVPVKFHAGLWKVPERLLRRSDLRQPLFPNSSPRLLRALKQAGARADVRAEAMGLEQMAMVFRNLVIA